MARSGSYTLVALGDPSIRRVLDVHEVDSPYNTYKHRGLPPWADSGMWTRAICRASSLLNTPLYMCVNREEWHHDFMDITKHLRSTALQSWLNKQRYTVEQTHQHALAGLVLAGSSLGMKAQAPFNLSIDSHRVSRRHASPNSITVLEDIGEPRKCHAFHPKPPVSAKYPTHRTEVWDYRRPKPAYADGKHCAGFHPATVECADQVENSDEFGFGSALTTTASTPWVSAPRHGELNDFIMNAQGSDDAMEWGLGSAKFHPQRRMVHGNQSPVEPIPDAHSARGRGPRMGHEHLAQRPTIACEETVWNALDLPP